MSVPGSARAPEASAAPGDASTRPCDAVPPGPGGAAIVPEAPLGAGDA